MAQNYHTQVHINILNIFRRQNRGKNSITQKKGRTLPSRTWKTS